MTDSDALQSSHNIVNLIAGGWTRLTFEPFKPGITIAPLQGIPATPHADDPAIALLKYVAGASVPKHRHRGVETILVLEGSQSDEHGKYETGTFVINPTGSEHSVWSEEGCVVLISWDKPVQFI